MNFVLFFSFLYSLLNAILGFIRWRREGMLIDLLPQLMVCVMIFIPFAISMHQFLTTDSNRIKIMKISITKMICSDYFDSYMARMRVLGNGYYCNPCMVNETRHGKATPVFFSKDSGFLDDEIISSLYNGIIVDADLDSLYDIFFDSDRLLKSELNSLLLSLVKGDKGSNIKINSSEDLERYKTADFGGEICKPLDMRILFVNNVIQFCFYEDNNIYVGNIEVREKDCPYYRRTMTLGVDSFRHKSITSFIKDMEMIVENNILTVKIRNFSKSYEGTEWNYQKTIVLISTIKWYERNPDIGIKSDENFVLRRGARIYHVINARDMIENISMGLFLKSFTIDYENNINEGLVRLDKVATEEFMGEFLGKDIRDLVNLVSDKYMGDLKHELLFSFLKNPCYLTFKSAMKWSKIKVGNWKFKRFCVDMNTILIHAGKWGVKGIDKSIPVSKFVQDKLKGINPSERKVDKLDKKYCWKEVLDIYNEGRYPLMNDKIESVIKKDLVNLILPRGVENFTVRDADEYGWKRGYSKTMKKFIRIRNLLLDFERGIGKKIGSDSIPFTEEQRKGEVNRCYLNALMKSKEGNEVIIRQANMLLSKCGIKQKEGKRATAEKMKREEKETCNPSEAEITEKLKKHNSAYDINRRIIKNCLYHKREEPGSWKPSKGFRKSPIIIARGNEDLVLRNSYELLSKLDTESMSKLKSTYKTLYKKVKEEEEKGVCVKDQPADVPSCSYDVEEDEQAVISKIEEKEESPVEMDTPVYTVEPELNNDDGNKIDESKMRRIDLLFKKRVSSRILKLYHIKYMSEDMEKYILNEVMNENWNVNDAIGLKDGDEELLSLFKDLVKKDGFEIDEEGIKNKKGLKMKMEDFSILNMRMYHSRSISSLCKKEQTEFEMSLITSRDKRPHPEGFWEKVEKRKQELFCRPTKGKEDDIEAVPVEVIQAPIEVERRVMGRSETIFQMKGMRPGRSVIYMSPNYISDESKEVMRLAVERKNFDMEDSIKLMESDLPLLAEKCDEINWGEFKLTKEGISGKRGVIYPTDKFSILNMRVYRNEQIGPQLRKEQKKFERDYHFRMIRE